MLFRSDADRARFLQDEMTELEHRAETLRHERESAEWTAAIAAIDELYVPMERELDELDARAHLILPEGDIFATLIVEPDGALEVRYWWASRKAKRAAEKAAASTEARSVSAGPIGKAAAGSSPSISGRAPVDGGSAIGSDYGMGYRQRADAAIRDDHGLTADAVQAMRSVRREVLRAALITDAVAATPGTIARDYLIWSLARDRLRDFSQRDDMRGIASMSVRSEMLPQPVHNLVESTQAHRIWKDAIGRLKTHPSMTGKDLVAAFDA